MSQLNGFSDEVLPFILAAGWTPSRHVEVPGLKEEGLHPALAALSMLTGLHVGECGPGVEGARSDIRFAHISSQWKEVAQWEAWLGTRLIGIGHVHHEHGQLYIDSSGRGFHFDLIGDSELCFLGDTLSASMRILLLGYHARPMLAPGRQSVDIYGETFDLNHPTVYRWDQR